MTGSRSCGDLTVRGVAGLGDPAVHGLVLVACWCFVLCVRADKQPKPDLWLKAERETAAIPMRLAMLSEVTGSDQAGQPPIPRVERVGPVIGFGRRDR